MQTNNSAKRGPSKSEHSTSAVRSRKGSRVPNEVLIDRVEFIKNIYEAKKDASLNKRQKHHCRQLSGEKDIKQRPSIKNFVQKPVKALKN